MTNASVGGRERGGMQAIPGAVFGKDRFSGQVVAVVEREQQIGVRDGVVGPHRQCLAAALLGFGVSALRLQHDRQIGENAVPLLRPRQRGSMMPFGLDRSPRLTEHGAECVKRIGVPGVDRQRLPQRDFGTIRCTARHLAQREAAQQPGLVRRVTQRFGQHRLQLRRRDADPAGHCPGSPAPGPSWGRAASARR